MFKFCGLMTNDAADLQKRVEQFKRDSEKPVQGPVEDFGDLLKKATQERRSGYHGIAATSRPAATSPSFVSAEDESFGERLRKAVERQAAQRSDSVQQTKERAERERARYRKPERRQRCKGE